MQEQEPVKSVSFRHKYTTQPYILSLNRRSSAELRICRSHLNVNRLKSLAMPPTHDERRTRHTDLPFINSPRIVLSWLYADQRPYSSAG